MTSYGPSRWIGPEINALRCSPGCQSVEKSAQRFKTNPTLKWSSRAACVPGARDRLGALAPPRRDPAAAAALLGMLSRGELLQR